jgi:TolA-binding protein
MFIKTLPIFFLFSLTLFSCAPIDTVQDVERLNSSIKELRTLQAEQNSKLSSLQSELSQITGRLETLEYSQEKRIGGDLSALQKDLSDLQKRVPPPPIVPASLLEEDESKLSRAPSEVRGALESAFQYLRNGKFSDAALRFNEALATTNGTALGVDIQFWLGVVAEGEGNTKDALRSYLMVVNQGARSRKAPYALLRQAEILIVVGDSKAAKATMRKLITDHPKSVEAAVARNRVKEIK